MIRIASWAFEMNYNSQITLYICDILISEKLPSMVFVRFFCAIVFPVFVIDPFIKAADPISKLSTFMKTS